MPSTTGERQIGNTLEEIAPNHIARYEWARDILVRELPKGSRILDAACGCAYGSLLLAQAGFKVTAVDCSSEAAEWSQQFKHPNVTFFQGDVMDALAFYDGAVSIETIEHIEDDKAWINGLLRAAPVLVGTVPNQDVVAFDKSKHPFHFRHYTKLDVERLMVGWDLSDWSTQYAKYERYEMTPGSDGMTLGFLAKRKGL